MQQTLPEKKPAALILAHLDVEIEPAALREFINDYWRLLAPLSHSIHGTHPIKPVAGANGGGGGGGGANV